MVLATAIITGVLVVLFGNLPSLVRGTYTVYLNFKEAPGVSVNSPVRKGGILIGRVADVVLNDDGTVLVTVKVNSNVKLRQTEEVRISASLLGDAALQIVSNPDRSKPQTIVENGEYMQGEVGPDIVQVVINLEHKVDDAIEKLGNAGDEVANLARNANNFLATNDEHFTRMITKSERAIDAFQHAIASIDEVVSDPQLKADLKRGLSEIPLLMSDTRETVKAMRDTVTTATGALASLQNNLKNFEGLTEPLRDNGKAIVMNMDRGLEHLNRTLSQLDQFTTDLNSSEGTISQLVHNPELYQEVLRTAKNLGDLTRDMKPIVHDARTLVKKVTQHPGVILRDAVAPGSGITGVSPVGYWDADRQCYVEGDPPR